MKFMNIENSTIPLSWAATTRKVPFANLGDALSPILVSALSGLPCVHRSFDSKTERLACVGTIGHGFKNGIVHFWGTGLDAKKNPVDRTLKCYRRPPNTIFNVHALRGPYTASILRNQNIDVPEVYGDPVWFLPSIVKSQEDKKYELGVIVHISELTELTDTANTLEHLLRYKVPKYLDSSIKIISTITKPTFDDLEKKIQEITSCKRIASTSLHGLVIAETYKIPCVYFQTRGKGVDFTALSGDESNKIDHRMRDFYSSVNLKKLFTYGQELNQETNWEELIKAIDTHWKPINWSGENFLEAFPLPLKFNPLNQEIFKNRELFNQIKL